MARGEPPSEASVFAVSDLTRDIQAVLAGSFGQIWVRGEVSQPKRSAAGHVYLTLKDASAVLPCVMWRSTAASSKFRLEDGQEVLVQGGIDVYPPHGRYQLIVRRIEPVGEGALRLAFEQLKKRLAEDGLFDEAKKQPLPSLPRRVALVTSPTGAAVRDMVTVMQRRCPSVRLLLVPVRVQGEGSAGEIARGLAFADVHADADVIVVGRGGGSLEDLWAFNEEVVARTISACKTPVVSAVGHETDVTIADLVADVRAATPSQAGELAVPLTAELLARLDATATQLQRRLRTLLDHAWQRLEALGDRPVLRDARALAASRRDGLEYLAARLAARSPAAELKRRQDALAALAPRLEPPLRRRLREAGESVEELGARTAAAATRAWRSMEGRATNLEQRLRALSPLAVLGRGYSLTSQKDGSVVRAATDVQVGDTIATRLADGGRLDSRVEGIEEARS